MSIRDVDWIDKIINLTSIVVDVENGEFKNKGEIRKEFTDIRELIKDYEVKALRAFELQNSCKHLEYHTPKWSLRKNIRDYYYYFEKTCKCCGHQETLTLENFNEHKDDFPEGFDGAVRVYYNLNI